MRNTRLPTLVLLLALTGAVHADIIAPPGDRPSSKTPPSAIPGPASVSESGCQKSRTATAPRTITVAGILGLAVLSLLWAQKRRRVAP